MTQTQRLKNKVALITGASRGIGAEVAKAYAKEGAHVILIARTVGGLEEVDDIIQQNGGQSTLLPFDLMKLSEIEKIGASIAERFKRLDIFVGNAGILGALSPVAQSDPKMWKKVFDINFFANQRFIRTLDPLLRGSDAGRAIFVTSGAAQSHTPFWAPYAASKAALETMVNTYANEVQQSPLKVNILDPGVVRTDMRAEAFPGEDAQTLQAPETIIEKFIELAIDNCSLHGQIIKAA